MKGYMPFPNAELRIPADYEDQIERYTRSRPSGGDRPDPEDAPFPRQVDMWFLAVCLGAINEARVALPANLSHKFNTASVFETDPPRIELLELLAIAASGDPYIISDPKKVIDLANEFAAGGLPLVLEMLDSGHSNAMDNLSGQIQRLLRASLQPSLEASVEASND